MTFPASHPALDAALLERGYETPTSVQSAVLEASDGQDLLVSAQTGSGKTVAFGIAMAESLLGEAERFGRADAPLALIIAPTRELAIQVQRELTWLYAKTGAKIVSCVGGMDARAEARALNFGAHIVVGTPGRLRDHLERGNLELTSLKVVVLDEADEMLDLGFREDLEFILETAPAERRTLLFSATIAKDIALLARKFQNDALRIDTTSKDQPHVDIDYRAVRVAPNEVEHAVVNVLRYFESPGALVFCHTREAVRHLQASLKERGFAVVGLSGELSQRERSDALQALRDGHARVCVATDVAARGLDLPDLGLVIHADLPQNKATLLHRSGRTGRAGRKGTSVLIVPYTRRRKAEMLFGSANIDAGWSGPPGAEEIRERDKARLLETAMTFEPVGEEDMALGKLLLEQKSPEEIAGAFMRLQRGGLPEPEELYDDGRGADARPAKGGPRERPERSEAPRGGYERPERAEYTPREPREGGMTDGIWFRLNVGRGKNADPKWILPMICRLGHVTKKDVGSIKIFDSETKFEISAEASVRFAEAVRATSREDVKIEPSTAPGIGDTRSPRPAGPAPRPAGRSGAGPGGPRKPYGEKKPYEKKPFDKKPPFKGPPPGKAGFAKGPKRKD
ncbi:MAG: DEAD/DEAH box helicase [Caulobacteraceae bacterium]|nr:DEAD/DEAH box helicase [Caulobacter sp.]RYF92973.1 MAG: DEAD/DEAH box helicase [Caulobacteraceae bacterium]